MSTLKVDTLQDTSGNGFYPARAWVSFINTGTITTLGSGSVSSITDLGTGNTRVTTSYAASDTNYYAHFSGSDSSLTAAKMLMSQVTGTTTSEYQSDNGSGTADNMENNYIIVGY